MLKIFKVVNSNKSLSVILFLFHFTNFPDPGPNEQAGDRIWGLKVPCAGSGIGCFSSIRFLRIWNVVLCALENLRDRVMPGWCLILAAAAGLKVRHRRTLHKLCHHDLHIEKRKSSPSNLDLIESGVILLVTGHGIAIQASSARVNKSAFGATCVRKWKRYDRFKNTGHIIWHCSRYWNQFWTRTVTRRTRA